MLPYSHRSAIDCKAIAFGHSCVGATRFAEDDGCLATADSIRAIDHKDSFDGSDG